MTGRVSAFGSTLSHCHGNTTLIILHESFSFRKCIAVKVLCVSSTSLSLTFNKSIDVKCIKIPSLEQSACCLNVKSLDLLHIYTPVMMSKNSQQISILKNDWFGCPGSHLWREICILLNCFSVLWVHIMLIEFLFHVVLSVRFFNNAKQQKVLQK